MIFFEKINTKNSTKEMSDRLAEKEYLLSIFYSHIEHFNVNYSYSVRKDSFKIYQGWDENFKILKCHDNYFLVLIPNPEYKKINDKYRNDIYIFEKLNIKTEGVLRNVHVQPKDKYTYKICIIFDSSAYERYISPKFLDIFGFEIRIRKEIKIKNLFKFSFPDNISIRNFYKESYNFFNFGLDNFFTLSTRCTSPYDLINLLVFDIRKKQVFYFVCFDIYRGFERSDIFSYVDGRLPIFKLCLKFPNKKNIDLKKINLWNDKRNKYFHDTAKKDTLIFVLNNNKLPVEIKLILLKKYYNIRKNLEK